MSEESKNLFGDIVPEENERLIKLTGSVENIIYTNEDNGYMVCDLGTDDDDLITITGVMPYVGEGDSLIVYGEWKHSPKYGRQFVVEQYERYMPANASAILRYLSSGAIKGIGKKTALKIVEEYGDNTLDVLENHPDWLSDIPGISLKKARQICEDFRAKAGIRSAMLFFRDYFGAATTVKIYKRWGSAAIDIAKSNPYRLCDEIDGIGFERADSMALKLGLDRNSGARLVSGISHVLRDGLIDNSILANRFYCRQLNNVRTDRVSAACYRRFFTEKQNDRAVLGKLFKSNVGSTDLFHFFKTPLKEIEI